MRGFLLLKIIKYDLLVILKNKKSVIFIIGRLVGSLPCVATPAATGGTVAVAAAATRNWSRRVAWHRDRKDYTTPASFARLADPATRNITRIVERNTLRPVRVIRLRVSGQHARQLTRKIHSAFVHLALLYFILLSRAIRVEHRFEIYFLTSPSGVRCASR